MSKWKELLSFYLDLDFETCIQVCDDIMSPVRSNIDDELENHPRLFSYYSGLYEKSKGDFDKEAIAFEYRKARIRQDIEDAFTGKRLTAMIMETRVASNEELHILEMDLASKREKLGYLKAIVAALAVKKDSLVQLSANARAEKNIYS